MKYIGMILLLVNFAFAGEAVKSDVKKKVERSAVVNDGIDFKEWESDFNHSMTKARKKVKKCEKNSKNCQFEKFQALDPAFEMVH